MQLLYSYEPTKKTKGGKVLQSFAKPTDLSKIERSEKQGVEERPSQNTDYSDDIIQNLFDNRSNLKQLISKISMHMKDATRRDFFKQIDELLDIEEFTEDDSLINQESFRAFLNFFSTTHNLKRTALTVTPSGNTVTSWIVPNEKLHIEFLPSGYSRTIASLVKNEEKETRAHQGSLDSMKEFLYDNKIMCWQQ